MPLLQNIRTRAQRFLFPGAVKRAEESELQRKALEQRLAQPKVAPPVAPPPQMPRVEPTAVVGESSVVSPTSLPPAQNPQLEAILRRVSETESEAKRLAEAQKKFQEQPQEQPGEAELKKSEEELLAAQARTPEEEQTEKTLANLLASREMGLTEIQDKPIAMEFITGQRAALERRAATQAVPLQTQLAQLQSKRQASLDIAKTRGEIAKQRFERAKPDEEKVDEFTNTEGQRAVAFRDKRTGKVRTEVIGKPGVKQSQTEKDRAIKVEVIKRARPELLKAKGEDGYVDPAIYLKLRSDYAQEIGNPTAFDQIFGPMLSPAERTRLGVGRVINTAEDIGDVLSQFLNQPQ